MGGEDQKDHRTTVDHSRSAGPVGPTSPLARASPGSKI